MSNVVKLIDILTRKELTLGSVESFTGGLFAKTITDVSGASSCFKGALVTYSTKLKESLLKIDEKYIQEKGVVSWEVAQKMAINGQKVLDCDICVSFTGNAGPEISEGKAGLGECYMAIYYDHKIWSVPVKLEADREQIREMCVNCIIDALLSIVC